MTEKEKMKENLKRKIEIVKKIKNTTNSKVIEKSNMKNYTK